jgi:hypothetical protein
VLTATARAEAELAQGDDDVAAPSHAASRTRRRSRGPCRVARVSARPRASA